MENWEMDKERWERLNKPRLIHEAMLWNQSYDDCGVYTCADDYKEGE